MIAKGALALRDTRPFRSDGQNRPWLPTAAPSTATTAIRKSMRCSRSMRLKALPGSGDFCMLRWRNSGSTETASRKRSPTIRSSPNRWHQRVQTRQGLGCKTIPDSVECGKSVIRRGRSANGRHHHERDEPTSPIQKRTESICMARAMIMPPMCLSLRRRAVRRQDRRTRSGYGLTGHLRATASKPRGAEMVAVRRYNNPHLRPAYWRQAIRQ